VKLVNKFTPLIFIFILTKLCLFIEDVPNTRSNLKTNPLKKDTRIGCSLNMAIFGIGYDIQLRIIVVVLGSRARLAPLGRGSRI
jgi:hypothetical protein